MDSICKKTRCVWGGSGGTEVVISKIKLCVYSVTPHVPWSSAECGVLEGKQIICPGAQHCLFLLLSLESWAWTNVQMWAQKTSVQLKTALRWFISFMAVLQECFVLSLGSPPACCSDMSWAKITHNHKPFCSLQLYSQPWVVTLHFFMFLFHSHCFKQSQNGKKE